MGGLYWRPQSLGTSATRPDEPPLRRAGIILNERRQYSRASAALGSAKFELSLVEQRNRPVAEPPLSTITRAPCLGNCHLFQKKWLQPKALKPSLRFGRRRRR